MKPHAILKKYLSRKQKANPRYSLRSFARDISVNPAFASRLLSGKQSVPAARLTRIAQVLELDALALKDLKKALAKEALAEIGLSLDELTEPVQKKSASVLTFDEKPFTAKEMSVLSPWYNLFILELATCTDFEGEPAWISKRLGIKKDEAKRGLDYLCSNGYLVEENGRLKKTGMQMRLPTRSSASIVRQFHRSVISRAILEMFRATDEASFKRRLITSASIAVNPANVEAAKERLASAQIEIGEILRDGPCTEVYGLNLSLFPITR